MIFVCKLLINKIKGYLFSILFLSGLPDNGPDKDSIKQNGLYSIYVGTRKGHQNGFTFKKKKKI